MAEETESGLALFDSCCFCPTAPVVAEAAISLFFAAPKMDWLAVCREWPHDCRLRIGNGNPALGLVIWVSPFGAGGEPPFAPATFVLAHAWHGELHAAWRSPCVASSGSLLLTVDPLRCEAEEEETLQMPVGSPSSVPIATWK